MTPSSMDSIIAPWGYHPFPDNNIVSWTCGPRTLKFRRHKGDLWIASEAFREPETESDWSRWALDGPCEGLEISPVFPDRSVVVAPEAPFHLPQKGSSATIYVRIPLWARVSLQRDKLDRPLTEIPLTTLSDTWFGSFTDGEICYWISSGARREAEKNVDRPWLALCPILIRNDSEDDLLLEKICLHTANLSLFAHEGQLMSDIALITFRGNNDVSEVSVSGRPPEPTAALVSLPREPLSTSFSARSFLSLASTFPRY